MGLLPPDTGMSDIHASGFMQEVKCWTASFTGRSRAGQVLWPYEEGVDLNQSGGGWLF
ncbi:MAG: hypothetical protein ACR2HF_03910 [Methylococcaceae bacterium]